MRRDHKVTGPASILQNGRVHVCVCACQSTSLYGCGTSALIATFLANLRTEAFFTCPELSLPEPQLGSEFYFGHLLGILLGFCAGCYWIFFSCTGSTCRNSLASLSLGQRYMSTDLATLTRLVRDLTVRVQDLEYNNLACNRIGGLVTNPPCNRLIEGCSTLHRGPQRFVTEGGTATNLYFWATPICTYIYIYVQL